MKILLGTVEVCGQLHNYSEGFRKLGHQVTSVIAVKDKYFPDLKYDIDLFNLEYTFFFNKTRSKLGAIILAKILLLANTFFKGIAKKIIINSLINQHDVFIFLWAERTLMPNFKDLEIIKQKGKKIVFFFLGGDVRNHQAFSSQYNVTKFNFPGEFKNQSILDSLKTIRNAEYYSDIIYSVPDQAGLAIKPYNHLQLAFDLNKYQFLIPDRDIPVIIHAPSQPWLKGTDVILEIIDLLKKDGLVFEFKLIQGLSNDKLLELLSSSDILVDEIIYHGPGILSFEAMACGCAVVTKYLEKESPTSFRPPVVNVNENDLYDNLKRLISSKALRKEIAQKGREYIEKNNECKIVANGIISDLRSEAISYNYYPSFYLEKYKPSLPSDMRIAVEILDNKLK